MDLDKAVQTAQELLDEDADNPYTAVSAGAQYNPLQELWIVDYVSTLTGEAPEGGGIVVPLKGAAYHFTSVPDADELFGIPPEDDDEFDDQVASSTRLDEPLPATRTPDGGILAPVRAESPDGQAVGDALLVLREGDPMFAEWDAWLKGQGL